MTVDNTKEGRAIIASLRNQVKSKGFKIRLRGRGHRFGKGRIRGKYVNGVFVATNRDNRYQSSLPLNMAQRIAVYISGGKLDAATEKFNLLQRKYYNRTGQWANLE